MEKKSIKQLVEYLESKATEAELLELCLSVEDRLLLERNLQKDLTGFLSRASSSKSTANTPRLDQAAKPTTTGSLKATSDEVVKRIRKDVALKIMSHLKKGPDKPTILANMLNISTGKMSGLITALVNRGDLSFDGKLVSLLKKDS
jgi:hypothetical protein